MTMVGMAEVDSALSGVGIPCSGDGALGGRKRWTHRRAARRRPRAPAAGPVPRNRLSANANPAPAAGPVHATVIANANPAPTAGPVHATVIANANPAPATGPGPVHATVIANTNPAPTANPVYATVIANANPAPTAGPVHATVTANANPAPFANPASVAGPAPGGDPAAPSARRRFRLRAGPGAHRLYTHHRRDRNRRASVRGQCQNPTKITGSAHQGKDCGESRVGSPAPIGGASEGFEEEDVDQAGDEEFDVEPFLLSRAHTSLPDLRSELRDYLWTLKEELVKLINDDYAAFISLSAPARGGRAAGCRYDPGQAGETGGVAGGEGAAAFTAQDLRTLSMTIRDRFRFVLEDGPEERARGGKAKHLGRVATGYTQLLYHTSKARAEQCAFVGRDPMANRPNTLNTLKPDGKTFDVEKNKLLSDLAECLRTYDAMGLWRDAEDVLRRDVVRRFVKKSIFPGALTAPTSPIIPHTPFRSSTTASSSNLPPRTPYTPFTSFGPKTPNSASASPYAHILEDKEDPLARLYSQILRFVERDMTRIMGLAEKIALKSATPSRKLLSASPDAEVEGFRIMANVVWEELGRSIMDELGTVVFAAGRPNEFRQHYETTQAFIRLLEFLAPSAHAVKSMRAHPVYAAFERRWQLPVYVQMRWKEIVGKVEESLVNTRVEMSKTTEKHSFVSVQGAAVWVAITACWSAESIQDVAQRQPDTGGRPGSGCIIVDARAMDINVQTLWREEISLMLPEAAAEERGANEVVDSGDDDDRTNVFTYRFYPHETVLRRVVARSIALDHPPRNVQQVVPERSQPFYSRHSATRKGVFPESGRPGSAPGGALKEHFVESYAEDIFEAVCQKYIMYLTAMQKTEESLRRLRKGKKSTFSLFGGGANAKDDDSTDDLRIQTQMKIDVEAFGMDAKSLGVDLERSQCYGTLTKMVNVAPEVPLIIVLCGHGEPGTGRLILGNRAGDHTFLSKEVLEEALGPERRSAINTFVVTSACISARWKSRMWTHYCAAGETSVSASDILWGAARHIDSDQDPTCVDSIALPASASSVSANLRQLNDDERVELVRFAGLATRYHVETPSSWPILRESRAALEQGVDALRPGVQRDLLFRLRRCGILPLQQKSGIARAKGRALRDAEDAGVPIHSEFFFEKNFRLGRWSIAPGTWLADAWVRAGKPSVSEDEWAAAIASCPM
ncbi:Conserved oligomeric Golgi complex subunit 2-like [Mycena kentingensis (nom. inval.)]|nr:Conserved oligomeric Golgi complex subunit 2-like [Mycena kentingensis (nom. inval.)]